VLHRDIKPENLVLDEKGYVRITDFGIAKLYQKENSSETSGTPGYMSPEVMCGQNHTIAVDYFALGVIGYEFMNARVFNFFICVETISWKNKERN
jgi:serum/glucocorticoid-regulated kinase 2